MTPVVDPFMAGRASAIPDGLKLELRGPADADHFRVKVGRYGDRWYHDPMPGCDIAPAWDGVVPSVSTAKKASGNDWSFVALKRVATAMESAPYDKLAQWKYADRYEGLKAINKNGLNGAAKRGTNVHLMAEAHLYGQPCPIKEGDPGFEYRGAVDQFFDQYQPTLVAAEFVCIHRDLNGVGYGGTADAILEIDGKRYLVDWKSRGVDSEHGAYPEEGAQIGAYARAGYTIAEGDFGPERRNMPDLDGGLIVSIKPDGCRVYPIDLDAAFNHWTALHAWWVARQDERKAVGRQWVTRKAAAQDVGEGGDQSPSDQSEHGGPSPTPDVEGPPVSTTSAMSVSPSTPLAGEVEACGKPPDTSPVVSPELREVLTDAKAEWDALTARREATPPADPDRLALVDARGSLCSSPDEGADWGGPTHAPMWVLLRDSYDTLNPAARSWRSELASQATRRGVDFLAQGGKTERRYWINKAIVALAIASDNTFGDADDPVTNILRELLAHIIGDVALYPGVEPGHALGSLGAVEAERFANHVDAYLTGAGGDAA